MSQFQKYDDYDWSTETVLPDPSTLAAIGLHHDLTSALADLVDNSIDAKASLIRVRFIQRGTSALGIQVIDNGLGMDSSALKKAMTFGARRDYKESELGNFGLGLKAASLSQSTSFEVFSRQEWGQAVGRRMDQSVSQDFSVGVLKEDTANERLDNIPGIDISHGTLVEWRGLKDVILTSDARELIEWRTSKVKAIREHLGIVFHRHLSEGKVAISIDTFDVGRNQTLPPIRVEPIDPFADSIQYRDYPQQFSMDLPDGTSCILEAHVFSPNLNTASFNLYGKPGDEHQGVYTYRRDRLLSIGGNWAGIRIPKKELGLGRIRIELDSTNERYITINPEKIGPTYSPTFLRAMRNARAASIESLDAYFKILNILQRESKKHKKREIRFVEPSMGLTPQVVSHLDNLQIFDDIEPINIRLVTLPSSELFRADRASRRIDVNVKFVRKIYGKEHTLSNRDAQLLKTFLYFLLQSDFKVEQRWTELREERHRILNEVLMAAIVEDFGGDQ